MRALFWLRVMRVLMRVRVLVFSPAAAIPIPIPTVCVTSMLFFSVIFGIAVAVRVRALVDAV